MVDPETQAEEAADAVGEPEGAEEAETGGERRRAKEARKPPDFQATAVQNLQRARRSLTSPDGEVNPRAQLLIQTSVAYALLDLAEAIRAHAPPQQRRRREKARLTDADDTAQPAEESPEPADEAPV